MQSIRLFLFVFLVAVIMCGALLMTGCSSSSGGSSAENNLNCTLSNVLSSAQCNSLSLGNSCQSLPTYDSKTKTCFTNSCSSCSQ
jgi:hypothetical protein